MKEILLATLILISLNAFSQARDGTSIDSCPCPDNPSSCGCRPFEYN